MASLNDDIVISDSLGRTAEMQQRDYITHALCRRGWCTFRMGNAEHRLAAGDCMILPQGSMPLLEKERSADFEVEVVYVSATFIDVSTPQSNYGMRGHLALFNDPVMHLTPAQQEVCALNFDYIRRRLALTAHNFHRDAMINAVQCMIIDFFDFHADLYGKRQVSGPQALLLEDFLAMLDRGEYRRHREVSHYADALCVTPKYLSEVCRKVSGQSAMYWITRYTALDISRTLRNRAVSLDEVTDLYGFSSVSYLTRYVMKHLGAPPSSFRN